MNKEKKAEIEQLYRQYEALFLSAILSEEEKHELATEVMKIIYEGREE